VSRTATEQHNRESSRDGRQDSQDAPQWRKICTPYSVDASKSRASAAVIVVTTRARTGADRRRDRTARITGSHSNAPTAATVYTRPYSRFGSGRLPYDAYMAVT